MKFDFVIGNPPYQDSSSSDSPRDLPVYDKFMDASYKISDKVLLITPARFLFNAGFTSDEWSRRMLNDGHIKVMSFVSDSSAIFSNTQIAGGVDITYRDGNKNFGKIGVFLPFPELVNIVNKTKSEHTMTEKISSRDLFHYSQQFFLDYPDKREENNGNDVVNSNAFSKHEEVFTIDATENDDIYFLGRKDNRRAMRYIKRNYINDNPYIDKYKVVFAQTNGGAGTITEKKEAVAVMGKPIILERGSGFTDSFICIAMEDKVSAENCAKYIKTKFARALLATLKRTGSITRNKWLNIPLQDFTNNSDIDWTRSIRDIDQQLYQKYNLNKEEIDFIEANVMEMD